MRRIRKRSRLSWALAPATAFSAARSLLDPQMLEGELRRDLPAPRILASMGNLLVLALREIGAGRLSADDAAETVSATLLKGITAER